MPQNLTISFLALLCGGILSCTQIAIDGQEYHEAILSGEQSKSIFRECQDLPNNTQVAISLIENGKVRFYGIKREHDTILTVSNRHRVFEIGSISKVFTATLLADLVLQNKLMLEHQVNTYLSIPFKDSLSFTFQQLANHTAGLPRMPSNFNILKADLQNPYKNYGEEQLEAYLATEMKIEDQGEFAYSNLGAGLLGFTLAKISEMTYEDLLQSRIFSRYQMTSSTTNRSLISDALVGGLNRKGKVTSNWDLNVLVAAGGILSSVSDLSNFATAQFDASNEVLALTRDPTYIGYHLNGAITGVGLGWMIKESAGRQWHWHNGGTGGYTSFMQIDVQNRNGVIILSNVSAFNSKRVNIDSLGERLMGSFYDKESNHNNS